MLIFMIIGIAVLKNPSEKVSVAITVFNGDGSTAILLQCMTVVRTATLPH